MYGYQAHGSRPWFYLATRYVPPDAKSPKTRQSQSSRVALSVILTGNAFVHKMATNLRSCRVHA